MEILAISYQKICSKERGDGYPLSPPPLLPLLGYTSAYLECFVSCSEQMEDTVCYVEPSVLVEASVRDKSEDSLHSISSCLCDHKGWQTKTRSLCNLKLYLAAFSSVPTGLLATSHSYVCMEDGVINSFSLGSLLPLHIPSFLNISSSGFHISVSHGTNGNKEFPVATSGLGSSRLAHCCLHRGFDSASRIHVWVSLSL